jgi:glucokinase
MLMNTTNMDKLIVGVDLGGTQVRAALAEPSGNFLKVVKNPSEAALGDPERVIDNIVRTAEEVLAGVDRQKVLGVGVAAPGPLSAKTGVVYAPANLRGWGNVPLRDILSHRLNLPVKLGNDANLAALGEYRYGAGKAYDYVVYITVSTGVGSGVVQNGEIVDGARGLAVEFGHTTIDINGPVCQCGNVGCIEVYASGTGLRRRGIEALQTGRTSLIRDMCAGDLNNLDAKIIGEAAKQGDALALELLAQAGKYLGAGIVNILHAYNPEIVVLGGGVTKNWDFMQSALFQHLERHAMPSFRENLPIVLTKLGDEIGLYGAVASFVGG